MSKTKKVYCVFLISLLILNYAVVGCSAFSTSNDTLSPRYDYVDDTYINIYKAGNKIYVEIRLSGDVGTTYEGGILTLRRTVDSNTVFLENLRNLSSSTSVYSYYNNSHDAVSGTYIVKFAIYAVKNGVRERVNLEKTLVV
ncbi:MAG: hypothetical protein E7591_09475 [Ruminococcaceae bacterium]|nr:hypothetical protein [Oscillospiraceae bacterium]